MIRRELLEPVTEFQLALENVSLGDVVQSPDALQSFRKFLRRGTILQRRQLFMEAHKLSTQASSSHEFHLVCSPSLGFDDSITYTSDVTSEICQKRRLDGLLQQSSPRNGSARKRRAPPSKVAFGLSNVTANSPSSTVISSTTFHPRESNKSPEDGHREIPVDKDGGVYGLTLEHVQSPRTTSSALSSNPAIPNILVRAKQFFEARLTTRANRAKYLVRAVQGFLEAPQLPCDFAKEMWNKKSAIFSKPQVTGSTARFRSLYEGHRKIKRGGEEYLAATRFCYIYLEHDLEQIIQSQKLVLSQGRGKVTAAFQLQAKNISITMDALRAERKAGRGYIRLLMEGGPGFVLRMGSNVSTIWERKLSVSDITLIIEFIKTYAGDLYDNIKLYDQAAVQALLNGFIAYGWTSTEIRETQSSLFDEIQRYANLNDQCPEETLEERPNIISLATPISEIWDGAMRQTESASLLSDLDLLLEERNQMVSVPTSSEQDSESVVGNEDFGYIGTTALELDQPLFEEDLDITFDTIDTSGSGIQDDLTLFHELFSEPTTYETSVHSLNSGCLYTSPEI
ncbi:uncharacterized protein EAF01_003786 [Botrytis porri]|uniref:Uncharacterized protein n=1 Tax=Botrytis porri TaxID=87229 RepID=A0A4Z1KCK1_9HELO|nr:uncharacterized protein EAF01_003786 [Botrytis porri]KAF7908031.1 hypothetical protein EAF01_003786 [Botrytis porri]TGO83126.1 hypothetical protein BPOR_0699g00080 [Botrytis porri]